MSKNTEIPPRRSLTPSDTPEKTTSLSQWPHKVCKGAECPPCCAKYYPGAYPATSTSTPSGICTRQADGTRDPQSTPMASSPLGPSSPQLRSFKPWWHVPRFRPAAIYEHRVARIRRDCRIGGDQHAVRGSTTDTKCAFTANEARCVQRRADIFFERCRQEWLRFHVTGALLSGYEWPIPWHRR
jgi:hypothetical protein